MTISAEVDANYARFTAQWKGDLADSIGALDAHDSDYADSYRRLVSLQAWRTSVLEQSMPEGSLAFFVEAQNDALSSHIMARTGSWRFALKALRSFLENVLSALYYADHPVELERWRKGRFRIGFSDLHQYLVDHPATHGVSQESLGLDLLKKEYATLSRAVHASGAGFRMTSDGKVNNVFVPEGPRVGKWLARERSTVLGTNLLLLGLFRADLQGSARLNLRKSVAIGIPGIVRERVKAEFGINLPV